MAIPKNIGKYYVREELGRGASSVVYRGYDPFANRDVAIKVFNPTGFSNDEQRRKFSKLFMTEAAMVGKLNHPHIVNIYDGVVDGEMDYIVMELVNGTALDTYAEMDKLLPIPTVMQLMFKCSSALDYACQQGVIHRDIKPANIMYTPEGEIKIADFGASLIVNMEQTQLAGVGSPAYMSPEQVREDALTHQTDIYSLGVVMYKLLTGRFPFDAENTFVLINKILNEPPLNIRDLRPEIPPALAAIVHRAMEKDTRRRYSQWSDLTADLAACVMPSKPATISIEDSEKYNTLKALAFFADFDDVELWEVLRISQWEKYAKGKVLMQEGDAGNFFLVLAEGSVLVTKMNKMLTTLKKGDCFGEMTYIDQANPQRSATVTASTPVTVINIPASALEQASNNLRLKFNSTFLKILVKRLAFANTRLAYLVS
jgi:serine/threonine protein kinase